MQRVLITGMSGTGKSSVVAALRAAGHHAIDTDDGWCVPQPDGRQLWDESAVAALLTDERAPTLFLAGCEENQGRFDFDLTILLSAPIPVILERLATRTTNVFGKDPADVSRIVADCEHVEPLLRACADHEIDTTVALPQVIEQILELAARAAPAGAP